MPAYSKASLREQKKKGPSPPPPPPAEEDDLLLLVDQDTAAKAGKRKTKHAAAKSLSAAADEDAPPHLAQPDDPDTMAGPNPPSPTKPQSILGQLSQQGRRPSHLDAFSDVANSQKVSDQHTPPTDAWARSIPYGRSPPVEAIPGVAGNAGSPPFDPAGPRGGFGGRSPPVSPPVRKARPVSYSSGVPPVPSRARMSTSPYNYSMNAYGSPPAPPHLPQQHFYGARDIDLGLGVPGQPRAQEPVLLKFISVPGHADEDCNTVVTAVDGDLAVLSREEDRLELVGGLRGVPGVILDATFLTWNTGSDPLADYRPLVALTVHGAHGGEHAGFGPLASNAEPPRSPQEIAFETRVAVYSLSKSCHVADLLHIPSHVRMPHLGPLPADVKIQASGNFLTVSLADSGEIYVFSLQKGKESEVFECLGKFWTTLQPHLQRRDSSHGPASDADVSPADLGRGRDGGQAPILSLCGRWMAYCPAGTPSRSSMGASLGEFVVYSKHANLSAGTAPSRPIVNCEVDSPDADSFLGKVAKGFAQEAVKGAKWIGEKGIQTWQSYWKKDPTSPVLPASTASSPPVYSPQLGGYAQFPPTHAADQHLASKDPGVVTIVDLRLLQETQGRKVLDHGIQATFQAPGGCSFLSFAPNGLSMLTANQKGDVQYVWDMIQMKLPKIPAPSETPKLPCVRQIAKYERLSPSSIVDVVWETSTNGRFALLTKNRTVHIFDLPKDASQWPPPRSKRDRPASASIDLSSVPSQHEPAPQGGFFASAMSIAGRTQPMLANLRGRAPSVGGGFTGIGATGLGLASTTGIKSGRAVAAGLSKSLGAATETMTSIRHANQSRLHLKVPARTGMLAWQHRDQKFVLCVLDASSIKTYYVRKTKPREDRGRETVSVFDARRAVATKLSKPIDLEAFPPPQHGPGGDDDDGSAYLMAFWKFRPNREGPCKVLPPLAHAEIDTNAPYALFHNDHRVKMLFYTNDQSSSAESTANHKWIFGNEIPVTHINNFSTSRPSNDYESVIYHKPEPTDTAADMISIVAEVTEPTEPRDTGFTPVIGGTKKKKGKKSGKPTAELIDGLLDESSSPQYSTKYDEL